MDCTLLIMRTGPLLRPEVTISPGTYALEAPPPGNAAAEWCAAAWREDVPDGLSHSRVQRWVPFVVYSGRCAEEPRGLQYSATFAIIPAGGNLAATVEKALRC